MKLFYTYSIRIFLCCLFNIGHITSYGQCILGSQYLSEEESKSSPASDDQSADLPANLLTNLRHISSFFNLNPSFRIYNDGKTANAKTYCSCQTPGCNNSTVFVGKKLITQYENNFQFQDGLWGLVAHEIAHAYQCSLGINTNLVGVQRELHADFLAGYYLGRKTKFTLTNIKQFADELYRRGDFKFNDEQHHGTPEQRVNMMLIGAAVNILTLDDASKYGYRLVTGQSNSYYILGNWAPNQNILSNNPIRVSIQTQAPNMNFQQFNIITGQYIAPPTLAVGMGGNQYRIIWSPSIQYPQGVVQDFYIVDNNKILVILSNGIVDIWLRM